jgi:hypothetical protein
MGLTIHYDLQLPGTLSEAEALDALEDPDFERLETEPLRPRPDE